MLKKYPLAFTSLIIGVLSFIQIFGLEKALLAVVLGVVALKDVAPGEEGGKKYALIGIILGSLYVLTLVVIMIVRGPEILGLIGKAGK